MISLLIRASCAEWAIKVIDRRNVESNDDPDAQTLLDEATQLEKVDLAQAFTKYQEVVEKYPDSSAGKVAKTCLKTMRPPNKAS